VNSQLAIKEERRALDLILRERDSRRGEYTGRDDKTSLKEGAFFFILEDNKQDLGFPS